MSYYFTENEEVHVLTLHAEDDDEMTIKVFRTFEDLARWIQDSIEEEEDDDFYPEVNELLDSLEENGYGNAFGIVYTYEIAKVISTEEV